MTSRPFLMRLFAVTFLGMTPLLSEAGDVLGRIDTRFDRSAADEDTVDFQRHLVPLLGKLGCNGRACHGSFQGQGGFQLSLFGYDFEKDHEGLLERLDLESPAESYALEKATNVDEHGGGERMAIGSWEYNVFQAWVKQQAPGELAPSTLTELRVEPAEITFTDAGDTTQFRVTAVWDDGSSEDVTPLCRFTTNDDQIATVSEDGLVTAVTPGDTHLVVFYDNGITPVPAMLPVSDQTGPHYPVVQTPTRVDELVVAKLRKLGVVPSERADDAMFLRRVSLDMTGTLPSPDEIRTFVADRSADKRARKIDELIASPAYDAWWATWLCDVTGNSADKLRNTGIGQSVAAEQWYDWAHKRVQENRPYDEIVRGFILADSRLDGESYTEYCARSSEDFRNKVASDDNSMPFFWARENFKKPQERAIGFAYTFLGVRIQCAECHKHPFDQWTQEDFRGFQQFFSTVTYGTNKKATSAERDVLLAALDVDTELNGNKLRKALVPLAKKGETVPFPELIVRPVREQRIPKNFAKLNAKQKKRIKERAARVRGRVLGGDDVKLSDYEDPREPLMNWLLGDAEQLFARAFVNRVWGHYFGRGIVEPTDDLSLANPPSNEPLLDYLARGFIEHDYDMQWVHRTIANSRTYQTSWRPNETNKLDEKNFARSFIRRLPAEVTVDVIAQATSSDAVHAGYRNELKGHETANPMRGARYQNRNYGLNVFGASIRETNCDCDRSNESSLLQTVYLRNDTDVIDGISRSQNGWLAEVADRWGQPFETVKMSRNGGKRTKKNAKPAARPADYDKRVAQLEKAIARLKKNGDKEKLKKTQRNLNRYIKRWKNAPAAADKSAVANANAADRQSRDIIGQDAMKRVIREAYLRTLSREPTADERAIALDAITSADAPMNGLRDVLWALVNTKEFVVNH